MSAWLLVSFVADTHDNALREIALLITEKIDSAYVLRIRMNADAKGDVISFCESQLGKRDGQERDSPSRKEPCSSTRQVLSRPNWEEVSLHQEGVSLPRRLPKSPGLVHVSSVTPLTET